MMIYSDTETTTIGYDQEVKSTYLLFKRPLDEEEIIQAQQEFLAAISSTEVKTSKHISDARALESLTFHSQEWYNKVIIPFIKEQSSEDKATIAIVINPELMQVINPNDLNSRITSDAKTGYFEDEATARAWLAVQ